MKALTALTEQQLDARVRKLARIQKTSLIALVLCLAEVHRRGVHLAAGYSSLSEYCQKVLGEERRRAWRLRRAAEAVASFPLAGELLEAGRLSFSALAAVRPALTDDNFAEVLYAACGMTEEEAEILASSYQPKPRRADSLRVFHQFEPQVVRPDEPPSPANVRLVEVERCEFRATLTPEVREQFEAVKAALSHQVPDGNFNDLLAICFRTTFEAYERQRLGSPRAAARRADAAKVAEVPGPGRTEAGLCDDALPGPGGTPESGCVVPGPGGELPVAKRVEAADRSRHIPLSVRRAVYERDEGCCSYEGKDGHRCGSTHQVQFDHLIAFCQGGEHTVENVRLLCARHNRFMAERVLGKQLMCKYLRAGRRQIESVAAAEMTH